MKIREASICFAVLFLFGATPVMAQEGSSASATQSMAAGSGGKSASQSDKTLARNVRKALSKAPGFDVSGVFVKAKAGVITLSGTVKSGDQIQQAEEVAKSVSGVTAVTNKLTLFHGGNG